MIAGQNTPKQRVRVWLQNKTDSPYSVNWTWQSLQARWRVYRAY